MLREREIDIQCRFTDRRETDKAHTGDTRARDIETEAAAATAAAAARRDQLTLELGKLRTQLAKVVGRGLVLLRAWG